MNSVEILAFLNEREVRLVRREGERLILNGPDTVLDDAAFGDVIRQHKEMLLELLASQTNGADQTIYAVENKAPAPVFIDLETRSRVSIKIGGRIYAADPSTSILSCVAAIDDRLIVWTPGRQPTALSWPEGFGAERPIEMFACNELPQPLVESIAAGRPFVAHNALSFERHVWAVKNLPAPSQWVDTMPWARSAGCPGSLDAAASWLLDRGKDKAGKKLIDRYCKPYGKARKFRDIPDDDWRSLIRYNLIDVLLLEELYWKLQRYDQEPELLSVDGQINERGVCLDRQLAKTVLALADSETGRLAEEAEKASGGAVKATDLGRKDFLTGWVASRGVELKGRTAKGKVRFTKDDIDKLRDREDLPGDVRAVLEARRATARTTVAKLERALEHVAENGRLRDQFSYHKAHTGRWAGRAVQLQNLFKPHATADVAALLAAAGDAERFRVALTSEITFADGLGALVRPCFCAVPGCAILIADFTAIEARGLAWCAGEEKLLAQFAAGEDVYCDFASLLFGRPITKDDKLEREVGKVTVLGCGYGMGAERFADTCVQKGVDLAAVGVTAEQVIETYRDAYPAIAGTRHPDGYGRVGGLWKALEKAAIVAVRDRDLGLAGHCTFAREGDSLVVTLPSGRRQYYRQARVEQRVPSYGGAPKPRLVYDSPEEGGEPRKGTKKGKGGHGRAEETYGGKITENIVSGICRDLLAGSMIRCERAGLPVVLHTHDEIVCEVLIASAAVGLRQLLQIMSTPPEWAKGFPVAVEGYMSLRYSKSPLPASKTFKASNGVIEDEGEIEKVAAKLEQAAVELPEVVADQSIVLGGDTVANGTVEASVGPAENRAACANVAQTNGKTDTPIAIADDTETAPITPSETAAMLSVHASDSPATTNGSGKQKSLAVSAPLKRHGGKYYLAKQIISLIPPHLHYCEPYFGSGAVLFARDPADQRLWWPHRTSDSRKVDGVSEVVNDLDGNLMNFYAVLKDPALFAQLRNRLDQTLVSEAEWEAACDLLAGKGGTPVERAAALFTSIRQSRQALQKDFVTPVRTRLRGGRQEHVNAWWSAVEGLEAVHRRLQNVLVLSRPAIEVIRLEDAAGTFIYADPPYVRSTRSAKDAYAEYEMTDEQHRELLEALASIQGKFLLSGYQNELYDGFAKQHGWHRLEWDMANSSGSGETKQRRIECVWANYPLSETEGE